MRSHLKAMNRFRKLRLPRFQSRASRSHLARDSFVMACCAVP